MGRSFTSAKLLLALALTWTPVTSFASGTGTLPLKINSGTGTMPLRMSGQAQSMSGAGQIPTQIVLTAASQPALDPASANRLHCQLSGDVSKHAAQGTILVASGAFNVIGICYNHDSQVMEVVGARSDGAEQSFMTGKLVAETPREFSGRLTVAGGATARYTFAVRRD